MLTNSKEQVICSWDNTIDIEPYVVFSVAKMLNYVLSALYNVKAIVCVLGGVLRSLDRYCFFNQVPAIAGIF